jgi:hypothetical protein
MPVPSQGHYGFHSFPVVDDFFCLYTYEFWLSLWKIVRSSVILLLPLYTNIQYIYNDQSLALLVFRDRVTVVAMFAVVCRLYIVGYNWKKKSEYTKEVIIIRQSKDRQHNDQKKTDKNRSTKHYS